MAVDAKRVKELRDISGAGMMDCKQALEETDGDMDSALRYLREQGVKIASKKAGREAGEGRVHSYIHGDGKIGVLVQVNCETDFVARNDQFKDFCKKLAMQIAASNPLVIDREDLTEEQVRTEKEILLAQLKDSDKPDNIKEKIVSGRLEKYYAEVCLLDQEWVHDSSEGTVGDVLTDLVATIGENMVVKNFARFEVGS